jgi:hypothetical protein
MEFKMAGKVILRASLVLALIITAHLIKPFSVKNVTQHLLYSAKSFRFALPGQLRDKFDHANYLAVNITNGMFAADEGIREFTRGMTVQLAFRPIDVQPLDEVNKSATKHRQGPKKSAPAKRINRPEKRSVVDPPILSSMIAIAHSNEFRLVDLYPARFIEVNGFPHVPPCLTKPIPVKIKAAAPISAVEAAFTSRKRDCEKRETDQKARIIWTEDETESKGAFWVVEKSGLRKINIHVAEPEEQKNDATGEEVETEIMRAEPAPPQTTEEQRAILPLSPFVKCHKDPR